MATHIIHKQKVVLEVPAQHDAFGYQGRVSSLFNNGLQTAIENVLDEMAAPGEVVRIDTLAINLGNIDAKQFDTGFKTKLVASLKEAVLKSKAGTAHNSSSTMAETKPAATSQRDAFMYFVLHGSLPWYSNAHNMQVWEEALFAQWQPADWKLAAEWLRTTQQEDANTIQRIVWQFSNAFIAQLAQHIYMLNSNVESITADTLLAWHTDIVNIASVTTAGAASLKTAVWLDFFDVLLGGGALTPVEKMVNRLVATQILRNKQNVAMFVTNNQDDLLLKLKTVPVSNAFLNIITALQHNQSLDVIGSLFNVQNTNPGEKGGTGAAANTISSPGTSDLNATPGNMQLVNSSVGNVTVTKPATPATEDVLYLNSCGLVLLHPFLGAYFSDIGLIENRQFIHKQAQQRAVLLLHYLSTGETEAAEFNLGLQKLLCGYLQQDTLPCFIELSDKEKYESEQLLRTVIDYWPPLKKTSVAGFQQTFLQRQGRLSVIQAGWLLRVEQKAVDVLLGKLPWGYSTIRLPWMAGMLNVEWA